MTAQVIDSVLYAATDTATLTAEAVTANLTITAPGNDQTVAGGNVTINWSGGKPGYSVQVRGTSGSANGFNHFKNDINTTTYNAPLGAGGNYTVTVMSSDGKKADLNFKKQ